MLTNQNISLLRGRWWWLSLIAVLLLPAGLISCSSPDTGKAVSSATFQKMMQDKNAVLLDVRTDQEYTAGHIPNARNLDMLKEDFAQQVQQMDKSKTYLLYCQSGRRSAQARQMMEDMGFNNTYDLAGGFSQWTGARINRTGQ